MRVPGGGSSCLGFGRPGSGSLPAPNTLPFGRAAGAHYALAVGAGGAGVGIRHQPHSAHSCELALRAVGAARGRPGGAPLAWVSGAMGRALSHPRPLVFSEVQPGPTTHWLWVRGVRAWGPVTNPTARALASWLCALCGRQEGAGRGRLSPGCWASEVERSPTADHSSFRACGESPLPTSCGCGGCGRKDPSPTPQRALLRAGFEHCRGGMRVPRGGASCLGVGRPGSGALPPLTTRLFRRAARAQYPLAVGAGDAGVGTRHQPHSARSCEVALRAVGAARGCPGGHLLPGCGASRVRRSPILDHSSFQACSPGPLPTGCGCGGMRAWGPVTDPTARAPASWLFTLWGRHEGARGGRPSPGCGESGVGRSPGPGRPFFGACGRGPLPTGCGCGSCGRGDPSPTPQRALLRAGFARCWGGMRVPGGGAPRLGVGRLGSGALPPPTARFLGRAAGAHYPLAVGAGAAGLGTHHQIHSALLRAGFARCGGGTRAPGGGASCLGVGRPGLGAFLPRPLSLSGVRPGANYPLAVGAGIAGGGPITNGTARAFASWLCALWGWHEGARGGRLLPGCGASGVGRSLSPEHSSFRACGRSSLPTGCGCGRGGPSPSPQRALFRADFARCRGGTRAPGGGASCLGVRRHGSGALPPPTTGPFGRAAGADYPLAVGAGGAGVGTRHQPHSARSCELVVRAVRAAQGCWRGRLSPRCWASEVERSPTADQSSFQACGRGPLPTSCGCGGCGPGDPSATPQRALLRACFVHCGGGMRVPGGGASCLGGAYGVGRPPTPDHSSFWACGRGPLPTGSGCGGCGRGDPSPTPQRALLGAGFARSGGGRGCPGGAPLAWLWNVRGRALSHTGPLVLSGVRPGPTTHWLWVRGMRAWGPVTNPTARALARLLCALWGRHEGARRWHLLPVCGASGDGRSPTSDLSSSPAGGRGPLPTGHGSGVRARGRG